MNRGIKPDCRDRLGAWGQLATGGHTEISISVRVKRPPFDGTAVPATQGVFVRRGLRSHFEISEKDRSLSKRKEPELRYPSKTPKRYMDPNKSSLQGTVRQWASLSNV